MRLVFLVLLLAAVGARAQDTGPFPSRSGPSYPDHSIQDNSFLIEEAYNQEPGVVQHINFFQRNWRTGEWLAAFTQEYPVPGIRHQLSYTISHLRVDTSTGTATGLGDLALNYRYQLVGGAEARVAMAPRLTLLVPTGDDRRALGSGSTGVQISIPVSTVLSERWIAHWNAGATTVFSARDEKGNKAKTSVYDFGASLIWLGRPLNAMLEALCLNAQTITGPGQTRRGTTFLINPGVRWAYDLPTGLEIVPGIGFPVAVGSGRPQYSLLLYLSFEHRFWSVPDSR